MSTDSKKVEPRQVVKKVFKIVSDVVVVAFVIFAVFGMIVTFTSKKDEDGAMTFMGMQMRVVISESMERCDATDVSGYEIKDIPLGSMIFIATAPDPEDTVATENWYASIKKGDVLTFKYVYDQQVTITHRVTDIVKNQKGGYSIYLEGDNKESDADTLTQKINTEDWNSPNYIIGKVVGQSRVIGFLTTALQKPIGIVCIVILPAAAVAIWELVKIIRIFGADKTEKSVAQQNEVEELKRKLAMLEAAQLGGGATPVATEAPSAEADSSPPVGDATEPVGGPTETVEKTTEQNNSVTNGEEP